MEACCKFEFQDRWMSVAALAEIGFSHYNLGMDVAFDGNMPVNAIGCIKAPNSLIEGNDGMINEHNSFFQKKILAESNVKASLLLFLGRKRRKDQRESKFESSNSI